MIYEAISLHCTTGSSNKEYHLQIEAFGQNRYLVNFQYGRRGTALKSGTKTVQPVSLAEAEKIYQKILQEKLNKGYVVVNTVSQPVQNGGLATAAAAQTTPQKPEVEVQLLNPVAETELEAIFADSRIGAQEKFDGNRMVLHKNGDDIKAFNRRGLPCSLPTPVADALAAMQVETILLDGEIVGQSFKAFDCLEINGQDFRSSDFLVRAIELSRVLNSATAIVRAPLEVTEKGKRALFEKLQAEGREGERTDKTVPDSFDSLKFKSEDD